MLFVDVLRSYVANREFEIHDFVVMPNHVHLLITIPGGSTIERAMQLVKGGFSYRLRCDFDYKGEVWQRGFSETRVIDPNSFQLHREYIAQNPVKAGLADKAEDFPFCFNTLAQQRCIGAKAQST